MTPPTAARLRAMYRQLDAARTFAVDNDDDWDWHEDLLAKTFNLSPRDRDRLALMELAEMEMEEIQEAEGS